MNPEKNELNPQAEITGAELEARLADEVQYWAIQSADAWQLNAQSCDCTEVILVMQNSILLAKKGCGGDEEDGSIRFYACPSFDETAFDLRILPPENGKIRFVKICYYPDGTVDSVKYRYGERYLYLFSGWELIVTKSIPDLLEEDDTPLPDVDTSILFDNKN